MEKLSTKLSRSRRSRKVFNKRLIEIIPDLKMPKLIYLQTLLQLRKISKRDLVILTNIILRAWKKCQTQLKMWGSWPETQSMPRRRSWLTSWPSRLRPSRVLLTRISTIWLRRERPHFKNTKSSSIKSKWFVASILRNMTWSLRPHKSKLRMSWISIKIGVKFSLSQLPWMMPDYSLLSQECMRRKRSGSRNMNLLETFLRNWSIR